MQGGLPILKARELIRILGRCGFQPVRQKGAHIFFKHPDGRATLVSRHDSEDIGRGALRQILREIKIAPDEFIHYL